MKRLVTATLIALPVIAAHADQIDIKAMQWEWDGLIEVEASGTDSDAFTQKEASEIANNIVVQVAVTF